MGSPAPFIEAQEPTPLLPPPQVATPLMVLNYAAYLEERSFFEDAFRAFERGVMVRLCPRYLAGRFALPMRPLLLCRLSHGRT